MDVRMIKTYFGVFPLLAIVGVTITGASACILYSIQSKKDVWLRKRPWIFSEPPAAAPKRMAYKPPDSHAENDLEVRDQDVNLMAQHADLQGTVVQ